MSEQPAGAGRPRPDRAAYAVAAVLLVVAGVIAWDAASLSGRVSAYSRIGAAAFPYGVAAALAAAAVGTVMAARKGEFPDREPLEIGPVAWILGGLIAQIVLVGFAGFSIATGVLFACAARGFGGRPLWLTLPAGILLSFILYVIFSQGLQLSLPEGPIERLI